MSFEPPHREFVRINLNVKEAEGHGVTLHNEEGKPYKHFEYKLIEPDQPLGDTVDFSQGAVRRSMQAGWAAAEAALGPPTFRPGAVPRPPGA